MHHGCPHGSWPKSSQICLWDVPVWRINHHAFFLRSYLHLIGQLEDHHGSSDHPILIADIQLERCFSRPARWGLWDFNIALRAFSSPLFSSPPSSPPRQLPISVGTAGPQPGTSRAQWAPLDLNRGPLESSQHRWTSTGDLSSPVSTAGPQPPDRMPDRMPEKMPDRMSDRKLEYISDRMPDRMPDIMSERMPDRMSEYMWDRMPDRMSEYMPDRMSEYLPDTMSEYMSDRMPKRMSNTMPEHMSDTMSEFMPDICQIECQNICQINCPNI